MKKTIAVFSVLALTIGLSFNTYAGRSITDGKESAAATESGTAVNSVLTLIASGTLAEPTNEQTAATNKVITATNDDRDSIPVVSQHVKVLEQAGSLTVDSSVSYAAPSGETATVDAASVNTTSKNTVNNSGTVATDKGTPVNINGYEYLTSWYDLSAVQEKAEGQGTLVHDIGEKVTVSLSIEELKGENAGDIVMLLVQDDGQVLLVEAETLDSETGVMTATVEELGAVAVVKKMALASLEVDSAASASEGVQKAISLQQEEDSSTKLAGSSITVKDVITAVDNKTDWKEDETIELFDGLNTVKIDPSKYSNVTDIKELAFIQGGAFIKNVKGISDICANLEYANTDAEKILKCANSIEDKTGVNVDPAEAAKDPSKLTELGSFVIPGSFLMQIDYSGNITYIYEPELEYKMLSAAEEEETADTEVNKLNTWTANIQTANTSDEYKDQELPVLTITGSMNPGGFVMLFIPEE